MLFSLLPIQVLAAGISEPSINSVPINQTKKTEGKIIGEVIDKRDINIKHFKKDDLTFEADVFPVAVHYQKDGQWQDIDNTLVDGKDEENNDVLENKANSYKAKIAKNMSSSKLVQIQKDGYEVSWNLEGTQETRSQVKPKDKEALKALSVDDKKRTLPNLSSTIDFIDIYPNIDLQYEVNPNDIKENIIIKEKVDNPLFIFNLNTKGLIPELLKDNSIAFYDVNNPEKKAIFSIDAPYMYDASNELSNDIVLTLEPAGKGYTLKVQPNNEWLSNTDRVFPIVIDPTLQTTQETSNITDNHVSEGLPNSNFENSHMLKTGNSTGGVHRTYIKFNLPTLTASDMVINANLYMNLLTPNSALRQVNVHKVQGDWSGGGIEGIKWSNINLSHMGSDN